MDFAQPLSWNRFSVVILLASPSITKLGITLTVSVCRAMQLGEISTPGRHKCFSSAVPTVTVNHCRSYLGAVRYVSRDVLIVGSFRFARCLHAFTGSSRLSIDGTCQCYVFILELGTTPHRCGPSRRSFLLKLIDWRTLQISIFYTTDTAQLRAFLVTLA